MENEVIIWKPISFSDIWRHTDTSKFDELAPSWFKKRESFKEGNKEYEEFINRLKRQHAIETGIIEKLYDVSEGITETFIKEGFIESIIGHDDSNIPPQKLMGYLSDHFDAINFIFDLVKSNRQLTKSFIKELHQLITRNQTSTTAIDTLGRRVEIELLKGEFKKTENNPRRNEGTKFLYCPPVHVDSEIDKLIKYYNDLVTKNINPIIISAWLHHSFTQIHPFQDGNGRIARLLASLVLIKSGLFPFTVKRNEKSVYIKALEEADNNRPNDLVVFFSNIQKRNIESVLNFKEEFIGIELSEVADLFNKKVSKLKVIQHQERVNLLDHNRNKIFDCVYKLIGEIKNELIEIISLDKATIKITSVTPGEENYYWYTKQIAEYASKHSYYFNKMLPRGWFRISFLIENVKRYDLIITLHHYSYEDSVIAVGSFLEFTNESIQEISAHADKTTTIPIEVEPYTISLESALDNFQKNIKEYIRDIVRVGLTIITNEII
jgi:Fic family protein